MTTARPLWSPAAPGATRTAAFRKHVCDKHRLGFETYEQLWRWSCDHRADFWSDLWDFEGVVGDKGAHVVDESAKPADNPAWFEDAQLNWAENQLRHAKTRPEAIALIQLGEPAGEDQAAERSLTYGELSVQVGRCQRAMREAGVEKGDRVGYWGGNCCEAAIVLLATSSLGAIFSSAAADFGLQGVQERFEQIKPKILFVTNSVVYAGVARPLMPLVTPLLEALSQPPLKTVVINHLPRGAAALDGQLTSWDDFMGLGNGNQETVFVRGGFNDPIWVLFSSGTTGKPKAIVHRQGGMLLQALKEHSLCGDIGSDDVFFYYTTTGWMMYQYLISGLSTGATVVLYEGSPLKPASAMFEIIDRLGVTVFGTSAKWIEQISKHYPQPKDHHSLKTLKQILSTGSPLPPVLFDFVYAQIKQDVLLGSITGGTDICSLFAGHNTSLPVYRGEIQCRMLAQDIDAFSIEPNVPGELVCKQAFPVQPVGFWPLAGYGYPQDEVERAAKRYKESYFEGVEPQRGWWWHGDHVQITPSKDGNGGGVVMLGRSDGVLNPGGIRFGPTDIYSILETAAFADSIDDALVVGQMIDGGADERVLLFVKLHNGSTLDADLVAKVKKAIRLGRSARHVPAKILAVQDIPATLNGKRVEVPIRKIINGSPVSTINPATLRNPECLSEYVAIGKELRAEVGM